MADYQQNFMNALQGGLQFGQQIKGIQDQRQLNQLASQAYGTPRDQRQSLLGQLASINPQAAAAQRKQWSADDEMDQEELVNMARFIKAAPPEQQVAAYSSILPKLRERGMQAPEWGPDTQQTILQTVDALVNAYGGKGANNPYDGLPSDIQSLKILSESPELAALDRERRQASGMVPKLVQTAQGYGWGTPGAGIELAPLEGVAGEAQTAPPNELFAALGQKYGIQPTSVQRTQQRNAEVGGVPNSYHLTGQAADWVVPQAQKAQFMQDARANGYEAIDEGDHIHIEPASRRAAGGNIAQPYQKPAAPPSGYRQNPDGTMAAIPGGPADVARQAREDAAAARKAAEDVKTQQKAQEANQRKMASDEAASGLISAIDQLTASPGFSDLGTTWGDAQIAAPFVRNDAKDAQAQLKNVAGQVALATLARLKSLSSTGATGFGSLTKPELDMVQNSISTLQSENISNAELTRSLKTIRDIMEKTVDWQPRENASGGYQVGQIIEGADGKRYRITDVSDPNDPDVEEVR